MRIAIDAMGGDRAPGPIIDGALRAARDLDIAVSLVGPIADLERQLAARPEASGLQVSLIDAPDVVTMDEPATTVLRRKSRASVRVAVESVARGEAEACFTAGHTGAAVLAAHRAFGMMPGVDRPALAATLPTLHGPAVLLDAGANVECRPQHLVQFALMGSVYAQVALRTKEPRVGLLSNGEEEAKGNELTREAYRLLKSTTPRFVGNVEARDVFAGKVDVIVCDGFTGNIALKVGEGLVDSLQELLRQELSRSVWSRIGAALCRPAFRRFRERIDDAEYGGVPLLGVAGLCIVGHGRSSARAVHNAIAMAVTFARDGFLGNVARQVASPPARPAEAPRAS